MRDLCGPERQRTASAKGSRAGWKNESKLKVSLVKFSTVRKKENRICICGSLRVENFCLIETANPLFANSQMINA